jgi:hypothetical protein
VVVKNEEIFWKEITIRWFYWNKKPQ